MSLDARHRARQAMRQLVLASRAGALATHLPVERLRGADAVAGRAPAADLPVLPLPPGVEEFVAEAPHVRRPIAEAVLEFAARAPAGSRVLDVGAGEAPYRGLFEHCEYLTVDWEGSIYGTTPDITATASGIPVDDAQFDAVLLTEVLEHVPDPVSVLREQLRILKPGGRILVTVPFVWHLHELPNDYARYAPAALERFAAEAGFDEPVVSARGNYFSALAQLMDNARGVIGSADDGLDPDRDLAGAALARLAQTVADLAPLDVVGLLPLGFSLEARRPAG
jgi:SAM-dependent methyltransferase